MVGRMVVLAKKKKRRTKKSLQSKIKLELLGLFLLFLAIFGSGSTIISDGAVSPLLENMFGLLFAIWYCIVSLLLTFEAIFPISAQYPSVIGESFTYYTDYIANDRSATYLGGGMIGAILFAISFFLFSNIGAKIVAFFLMIVGIIIFSNLSMGDLFAK